MPKFVGVSYLRFDDTFYVKVNQEVLDEAKKIIMDIHDLIKEKEEMEDWEQTPQNLCKWCSFHESKGGPCDAEIPKWRPPAGSKPRRKYAKAVNSTLSEDDIAKYLPQPEEEEQK